MSNALTKSVDMATRRIPRQILERVFLSPDNPWHNAPKSLAFEITEKVIRPRVIDDCNILSGIEDIIRLTGLRFERTPELMTVVHIPKERTAGRTIISPLSLSYIDYTGNGNFNPAPNFNACSVTPLLQAASLVGASYTPSMNLGTTRLEMVAENTLLIKDTYTMPANASLRCIMSNDADMNNLPLRAIGHFADLCTLAIKSHVYNEMIVTMDEGVAQAGRNIGAYRQIIERYESAEEEYAEMLKFFKRVMQMSDRETHTRIIRGQISRGR